MSEIDSDDKIDDDYNGDSANAFVVKSKKNLKQIKRKRGSQKKLKKKYLLYNLY